ncbi:hypothetical protein DLAC_02423 [Tieghemostelium lacteum]|uniref:Carbohydrate binding domain-containing protein n=1 Tax=Tieghemostelium lacteum TaxID=361077 RepID=A0A152A3X2_TIELA|nr:hypothetical protein DLAC_02423 [Tieghemostelium lacteum]|eukprot:KYR00982.1 hypothetical protein DLAC_02423 [Tieghemostelium lacteum]
MQYKYYIIVISALVALINIGLKAKISEKSYFQEVTCFDYPTMCTDTQYCLILNETKKIECVENRNININVKQVSSYTQDEQVYYQYQVEIKNNAYQGIKELQVYAPDGKLNLRDHDSSWNFDRFPNGDIAVPPHDRNELLQESYQFGFIVSKEINSLKIKSILY